MPPSWQVCDRTARLPRSRIGHQKLHPSTPQESFGKLWKHKTLLNVLIYKISLFKVAGTLGSVQILHPHPSHQLKLQQQQHHKVPLQPQQHMLAPLSVDSNLMVMTLISKHFALLWIAKLSLTVSIDWEALSSLVYLSIPFISTDDILDHTNHIFSESLSSGNDKDQDEDIRKDK